MNSRTTEAIQTIVAPRQGIDDEAIGLLSIGDWSLTAENNAREIDLEIDPEIEVQYAAAPPFERHMSFRSS